MTTKFQQRHYEEFASMFQRLHNHCDEHRKMDLHGVMREMADIFTRDNYNFDRGRFERACVPGANVRSRKVA